MLIFIGRIAVSALVVIFVYMFGYNEAKKDLGKEAKTNLCLGDRCDGCKKIKPVVSNLEHDRFGRVTKVHISCSKIGSCKGRKDEVG